MVPQEWDTWLKYVMQRHAYIHAIIRHKDNLIWFFLQICDLASTDRPDACASKPLAPAYAYNVETDECDILGDLKYDFAVSDCAII